MKINGAKCRIIFPSDQGIVIDGDKVENVEEFVFLGRVLPKSAKDVIRRMGLTSTAFDRLSDAIWKKMSINNALKIRLYNALIVPKATYASETWILRSGKTCRLEVFEMRCLRAILGVTRRERLRNEHICKALQIKNTITDVVNQKRLR